MTAAINIYLKLIAMTGAMPFNLSLPQTANSINADMMTDCELHAALDKGLLDIKAGNTENVAEFFSSFRKTHLKD